MQYTNPIIRGFNPDPSICRVGSDFYLVTSTFEFFPGIPVYHSTDLVNWRLLGSCIDRVEQLPYEYAATNMGIWAPTIRWHAGRFYVTAKFKAHGDKEYGNFIVSTTDPAKGWSDPVRVDIGGIDPSLLFDGGRVYYCTNQRAPDGASAISMAEIDPDTGVLLTDVRPIWHGMSSDRPQYLEAPHVYHVGQWYYVIAAEGGTGFEHMITAGRSRSVWGPYEDCPYTLLTNRYAQPNGVACSGHGDLVEAPDGSWWCVHLATRPDDRWYSHLGRETFLLPVTWQDGWPVIADGVSHLHCEGPLRAAQQMPPPWTADLARIEPQWLFLRRPQLQNYVCGPDGMALIPTQDRLSDAQGAPTMMMIRQCDVNCTVEAEIDFTPQQDGDEAGMTIFISSDGWYTFGVRREEGRDWLCIDRSGGAFAPLRTQISAGCGTWRIVADKTHYRLYHASGGGPLTLAAAVPVLGRADAGKCFTGTLIGVYAQCACKTGARAVLRRFRASADGWK